MNVRVLLLCLALASSPALAGDAIHVSLESRVPLGQGLPALKVEILEPILGFDVKLKRSDGKEFEFKDGGKPGMTRTLELEQPEGRFHYEGELTVRFKGSEPGKMPLSFDTELLGPLTLTVSKEDLDLAARKLRFKLSRPAGKAKLTVVSDSGWNAFDGEIKFKGEPAGTPLEVTWPKPAGKVLKISLKAYDTADFFQSVEFFPWQVDIPHEEVIFASGSAEVPAAERSKLDKSVAKISEAVKRYGEFAPLRLYILGHTDTVGPTPANRELSLQRARSIAAYFRTHGARLPIYFEGFGEQAPHKPTPDETAEPANRRAEYIISVDDPSLTHAPFSPQWRPL